MTGFLLKDKFDRNLTSALKQKGIHITNKNENIYFFKLEDDEVKSNVKALRESFETNGNADFEGFADEILSDIKLAHELELFMNAQFFLYPLTVKEEEITDEMIALPFSGKIFKAVFCMNESEKIVPLDKEYLKKWNMPKEALFTVADRNLGKMFSKVTTSFTEITNGVKAVEFEYNGSIPVSSMILCSGFKDYVAENIGECFLAAIPSEKTLFAVQDISEKLISDLKNAVYKEYEWADNPVSTDIYRFNSDGTVSVIN